MVYDGQWRGCINTIRILKRRIDNTLWYTDPDNRKNYSDDEEKINIFFTIIVWITNVDKVKFLGILFNRGFKIDLIIVHFQNAPCIKWVNISANRLFDNLLSINTNLRKKRAFASPFCWPPYLDLSHTVIR